MKFGVSQEQKEAYFDKGPVKKWPFVHLALDVAIVTIGILMNFPTFILTMFACTGIYAAWNCVREVMISKGKWKRNPVKTLTVEGRLW